MREADALKSSARLGWDCMLAITAASATFAVVAGADYAATARAANWLSVAVGIAAIFGMIFWLAAIIFAAPLAALICWLAKLFRFQRSLSFFLLLGAACSFPMAILLDAALTPLSASPGMVSVQTGFALPDVLAFFSWTAPACLVGAATFWVRTKRGFQLEAEA